MQDRSCVLDFFKRPHYRRCACCPSSLILKLLNLEQSNIVRMHPKRLYRCQSYTTWGGDKNMAARLVADSRVVVGRSGRRQVALCYGILVRAHMIAPITVRVGHLPAPEEPTETTVATLRRITPLLSIAELAGGCLVGERESAAERLEPPFTKE